MKNETKSRGESGKEEKQFRREWREIANRVFFPGEENLKSIFVEQEVPGNFQPKHIRIWLS